MQFEFDNHLFYNRGREVDLPAMNRVPTPPAIALESQEKHVSSSGTIPVLVVRNLTKVYYVGQTEVPALRGVSLDVYPNEFVAIMGASGSGKSTFMNLIGCLDQPDSGEYKLMGTAVSHMTVRELAIVRNEYLGFVFQGFNLLPRATALDNVALPLLYAGVPKEERERRARKALEVVGLGTRLHHTPSQLSGGQQQRVAIARALVNNPLLLLADEPTGNLDSHTSVEIMALLQDLNQQGLTIVLITHEPDIAAYAGRRVTFRDGRIVSDEAIATSSPAEANLASTQGKAYPDPKPQLGARTEDVPMLSPNTGIQQSSEASVAVSVPSAMPAVPKEEEKRSASAPLEERAFRGSPPSARRSPDSSLRLPQVRRLSKFPGHLLLISLALCVTFVLATWDICSEKRYVKKRFTNDLFN